VSYLCLLFIQVSVLTLYSVTFELPGSPVMTTNQCQSTVYEEDPSGVAPLLCNNGHPSRTYKIFNSFLCSSSEPNLVPVCWSGYFMKLVDLLEFIPAPGLTTSCNLASSNFVICRNFSQNYLLFLLLSPPVSCQ